MVDSFQRNSLWFSAVFSGKLVQKDVEILQWRAHSMPKRSSFCRGQGMSPKATFGPWLTLKALSVSSVAAELRFLKDISSSFFVPPNLHPTVNAQRFFSLFALSFYCIYGRWCMLTQLTAVIVPEYMYVKLLCWTPSTYVVMHVNCIIIKLGEKE